MSSGKLVGFQVLSTDNTILNLTTHQTLNLIQLGKLEGVVYNSKLNTIDWGNQNIDKIPTTQSNLIKSNHKRALDYLNKCKVMGIPPFDVTYLSNDRVRLNSVPNYDQEKIVIPSFITNFDFDADCDYKLGPLSRCYASRVHVDNSPILDINCSGICANMDTDTLKLTFSNPDRITSLAYAFNDCEYLSEIDISTLRTPNLASMKGMFMGCLSLQYISMQNLITSKVVNMSNLFTDCQYTSELDLSNFDTANVKDMSAMFAGCVNLLHLDLSNFNTSSVTNMRDMFGNCISLSSLDISSFDTAKVKSMKNMFKLCVNLSHLDISHFNIRDDCDTTNMLDRVDKV